jgi:RNA polymerase sigma-70 factor, ECF subfamily
MQPPPDHTRVWFDELPNRGSGTIGDRMSTAEDEFTAFYDATWRRTLACAYAVTGDLGAAEEVAQEAYARAWPRWSKLVAYDDPGAWVRQVATRQAISRWRRSRTALRHLARSRPPEPAPPPDETSMALMSALRRLPPAQQRALVLHHLAGFSVADIAALERCPAGTVKARLSRGRAALVPLLRDTQNGEPSHA